MLANAANHPDSHEGPNEHDIAVLPDGTLMAVVRFDGGDGCSASGPDETQHYSNYHSSISTDMGQTWSAPTPLPAGCARPRLLTFGSSLVLTGGRHRNANTSDVLLWYNADGRGTAWQAYSLSYHHNKGVASGGRRPNVRVFDERVNKSTDFVLPRETNAYTSVFQIDDSRLIVFYDQKLPCALAEGRGGGCMTTSSYSMVVELSAGS